MVDWLEHCICNFQLQVRFLAMTLSSYFWDRWLPFEGKLSWDITTTQVNSALHLSRVAKSITSFVWLKEGKVTAARLQVTLWDPVWHVISCSGEVILITNCYIQFTYLLQPKQALDILTLDGCKVESTWVVVISQECNIDDHCWCVCMYIICLLCCH